MFQEYTGQKMLCCKETYITYFSSKKSITLLEIEFDDLLNMMLLK